jgi:hypothetical protein
VRAGEQASLDWYGFGDLTAALLYEFLAFRQGIFVVEQCCAYPDRRMVSTSARSFAAAGGWRARRCLRLILMTCGSRSAAWR